MRRIISVAVLLLTLHLISAPVHAGVSHQMRQIYGLVGTLRLAESNRYNLELVTDAAVYPVVGETAAIESQLQSARQRRPAATVKVWGTLMDDPTNSERQQIVVNELLVLTEQDGQEVFLPFTGADEDDVTRTEPGPDPDTVDPDGQQPVSDIPLSTERWRVTYFPDQSLSGQPALRTTTRTIDFNWNDDSPAAGIPADGFSARFERLLGQLDGFYEFSVQADDGVRVWIDGEQVLDQWHLAAPPTYRFGREITRTVPIRVEYYEAGGQASIRLNYEIRREFSEWKASYFDTIDLTGGPDWIQAEPRGTVALQHAWSLDSPVPDVIPADNWSGRWEGTFDFEGGNYVFWARADDGIRLWIDDMLVLDAWERGGYVEQTFYGIGPGQHRIRIEFYERGGIARLSASWYRGTSQQLPR